MLRQLFRIATGLCLLLSAAACNAPVPTEPPPGLLQAYVGAPLLIRRLPNGSYAFYVRGASDSTGRQAPQASTGKLVPAPGGYRFVAAPAGALVPEAPATQDVPAPNRRVLFVSVSLLHDPIAKDRVPNRPVYVVDAEGDTLAAGRSNQVGRANVYVPRELWVGRRVAEAAAFLEARAYSNEPLSADELDSLAAATNSRVQPRAWAMPLEVHIGLPDNTYQRVPLPKDVRGYEIRLHVGPEPLALGLTEAFVAPVGDGLEYDVAWQTGDGVSRHSRMRILSR